MAYEVRENWLKLAGGAGTRVLEIADAGTPRRWWLCPDLGANLLSWQEDRAGQPLELLWHDLATLTSATAARHGIPILFPFANRIRGGAFYWDGQRFQLPLNSPHGHNAIHGYVLNRPWEVVNTAIRSNAVQVRLRREVLGNEPTPWPGPLELSLNITFQPRHVSLQFTVATPGAMAVPWSLGLHPYFRLPPEEAGVFVHCPPEKVSQWELRDCLPTGGRLPLKGKFLRLLKGQQKPWGTQRFDDLLHVGSQGPITWQIKSPQGWSLEVEAQGGFREFVVFTPDHRQALCLEPYTAATDAINLHARGLHAGLRIAKPGEPWHGRIELRFRDAAAT